MILQVFLTGLFGLLLAIIILLRLLSYFIPELLVNPPEKLRLRVNKSLLSCGKDLNKIPVLNFGWKHASVRRSFILASQKPSDYTNKIYGEKNHIAYADRQNREIFVNNLRETSGRKLLGFFHPYCNAGGGGEKVLWKAVETSLRQDKSNVCIIYTGDNDVNGNEILQSVQGRFGYELDSDRVVFIFLQKRYLVDSSHWPSFTLLGQALGSVLLSVEALSLLTPDYWIDTMGYPFGYPFVSWFANIPIVTYTHYPVISTDMLVKLKNMPGFKANLKLRVKYAYWTIFMWIYKVSGSFVDVAAANSTWTYNHIRSIWSGTRDIEIVYPPCSTESLIEGIKTSNISKRKNQAVVIAQFRPEKRHELIISSFSEFIEQTESSDIPKLILIGSTRNESDREYVESLMNLAFKKLSIPKHLLEFKTDCKYDEMKQILYKSWFGINAMWNEHFGIAVVEYLASGLIPLCHASAGPLYDIVVPWDLKSNEQSDDEQNLTGFFFKDKSDPDYNSNAKSQFPTLCELFHKISSLTFDERTKISERGQKCSLAKFSDAKFQDSWNKILNKISTI